MNVMMAALSVQLALYGTAWAVFAATFHLYPQVSVRWAAGWFLSAMGTTLLFLRPAPLLGVLDLLVNSAIIGAFSCLHQGMALFAREPLRNGPLWIAGGIVVLIEIVRHALPDTMVLRTWMFTVAAFLPLSLLVQDFMLRLRKRFALERGVVVALALPVVLTLMAFVVRAAVITYSDITGIVELDTGSTFDIVISLLFLVFLGMFNFSLYNLVLGSLISRLENLSSTDQLTGLYNRRIVMERLAEEHARFLRSGQTYAVIMLDLDHFKRVNDTYGHAAGDAVLREVAQRLRQSVRGTDTLARMGGEEFLLLLPMNDVDGALIHAGRIRKRIGGDPIATPQGAIAITASLGVAEVSFSDKTAQTVVSRADAALYQAKAHGRNRVESAHRATIAHPQD
ncbi:GGDEF domain-containing protein [Curvibacter sp. APW13]|uniref:GGDEF domain-containing protein n=1 Tax=Curvibacter sp. APW13 TaxID=3077236 RepID=UPI0028E072E1|nr:GGDEF domain-containing protein [Curvibacter sp. APW13]MDT8990256.1 GGDEF domain-containing protein [Curvibacter sp. APW13]